MPLSPYNTVLNWNPVAAMAANVNAFVPSGAISVTVGGSVTILVRPQTPGLGAVTNGVYTIPTGTYTLTDTVSGTPMTFASGTLDAAGEAYFTTSSLSVGAHSLTWTYSGDANFSGSTTSSAYVLTVNPVATTTTLSANANPIVYGGSASITATVAPASGSTNRSRHGDSDYRWRRHAIGGLSKAPRLHRGRTVGVYTAFRRATGGGTFAASSTAPIFR